MFFRSAEKSRQDSFSHHFLLLACIRITWRVANTQIASVPPFDFLIQSFGGLAWEPAFSNKSLAHADAAGQGPHFENQCTAMTREVVSGSVAREN